MQNKCKTYKVANNLRWNFRTINGARNQVGIRMPYRSARLYRLTKLILKTNSWAP
jgi:hypothetical protein